ncbi:MAG: hypothetical protein J7501_08685, partial [Bdellovibrio sp.]|nr:hypothetical protein [Bdellovibrio sp.]
MIDSYGLYVQADGSNGDSAHRTGLAATLLALNGEQAKSQELISRIKTHLEISSGVFRRSPYGDTFDTNPRCMSRDQVSRLILAFAVNGEQQEISHWLTQMRRRGFFHQNNLDDRTLRWK